MKSRECSKTATTPEKTKKRRYEAKNMTGNWVPRKGIIWNRASNYVRSLVTSFYDKYSLKEVQEYILAA